MDILYSPAFWAAIVIMLLIVLGRVVAYVTGERYEG